ncbi:MAG: hypothetical protein AB8B48_18560 [Pseudomonadales bacterium]
MKKRFLLPAFLITLYACSNGNEPQFSTFVAPVPEPPVTLGQETETIASVARPANTPGTDGVSVSNPKLLAHFGDAGPDLNTATYTRYFLSNAADAQPDAILITIPGFQGGAANFARMAEQLMRMASDEQEMILELWAFDRRSEQLEDRAGLELAEIEQDANLGLDFLFGAELGLDLDERLVAGPNRRLVSYNSTDLAFMANWSALTHSQDIDAVVERARGVARNQNVFLGGHSAGTGFMARYAATDFDIDTNAVDAGFSKLRGLVLFEGGGGSLGDAVTDDTLNRIEARFDGGLFGAVSANAARCVDGLTACSIATEATDCAAFTNTSCTEPRTSFAAGLINTETFAAGELVALDGDLNGDTGVSVLLQDQNEVAGNNALAQVAALLPVRILLGGGIGSSIALYGQYLDDDGLGAAAAPFLATSIGAPGPEVDGALTWLNRDEELPDSVLSDNGAAPTEPREGRLWGVEVEPTDFEGQLIGATYRGDTNFFDWYYPSSGLSITTGLGLDTTALSAPAPMGRGRSDIDNRTQAQNIDIPIIAFGGSNGLTPVPGDFFGFASAIATCTAPSCDSTTPRIVDPSQPSLAFPTYGDVNGGYEVFISEGYSHVDIVTAENEANNQVIAPLLAFLQRNVQ